jgi:hypothetical protein
MKSAAAPGLFVLSLLMSVNLAAQTPTSDTSPPLTRTYQLGEQVGYKMLGVNVSPQRDFRYEAHARGVVQKTDAGAFVEIFGWNALRVSGQPFPLSPLSEQFKEPLSLAPGYKLSVPDLSKVQPVLIGPITDLLTFYVDVQLAMRQSGLAGAGDHVYVKHGTPNSWADGHYTLLGQDSVDFDLTLVSVDPKTHIATLIVRHVPPEQPQIHVPATWMADPVGPARNNWVQVQKLGDGSFVASVGEETFEADIRIDTTMGRILSAHLDNPVEVKERVCKDEALTSCADPSRYHIQRTIDIEAESTSGQ